MHPQSEVCQRSPPNSHPPAASGRKPRALNLKKEGIGPLVSLLWDSSLSRDCKSVKTGSCACAEGVGGTQEPAPKLRNGRDRAHKRAKGKPRPDLLCPSNPASPFLLT
ncbi:hypothetical protein SKAU_G00353680 [Synaphobranchus kaupii]|uniref:Uncharacterized protein n=1 Tax=Synaphobranchus kaupii TaxID=118154 RepID=A0A9Q1EL64_SYNKA|nr:hypothetical protein SKAU_G00353680 [Synaphobranchus kaupii]